MKDVHRIAIIIPTLMKGGAEKQSVFLANVLSNNYKVYLIILKGNCIEPSLYEMLDENKVEIIKLKNSTLKNIISIYKLFKKNEITTVFSYLASANFINGFVGKIAKVQNRIGGIRNAQLSRKKLPFERFFHNKLLTTSISNSYSAVTELTQKGFNKSKFHVIHNAFDLKQELLERLSKKNINVLSVARFVPQKDYFTAIDAVKLIVEPLKKTEYTFRYFIVGYGAQEKEIRDRIKKLDLEKHIEVVINPNNVFEYFKKADIFLTTSLYEGMSNSVMEAMSFSLPIVTTNAGDMEFLVKDNYNGYICPFKDSKMISDKILELVTNYKLRSQMGLNSYSMLENSFSLQNFSKNYTNLLNSFKN